MPRIFDLCVHIIFAISLWLKPLACCHSEFRCFQRQLKGIVSQRNVSVSDRCVRIWLCKVRCYRQVCQWDWRDVVSKRFPVVSFMHTTNCHCNSGYISIEDVVQYFTRTEWVSQHSELALLCRLAPLYPLWRLRHGRPVWKWHSHVLKQHTLVSCVMFSFNSPSLVTF